MINVVKGDLIEMADRGLFQVIAHGANCQATMGAGIAKQIANRWPLAAQVDRDARSRVAEGYVLLGKFSMCKVNTHANTSLIICNLYTQVYYGRGVQVDYDAIHKSIKSMIESMPWGYRFGMPKIGAGLGGGDWNTIYRIIASLISTDQDMTIVEYNQ